MKAQVKLGRIAGISVGLHYSWFIIALLIALSLVAALSCSRATRHDAASLYDKLESVILPLFYRNLDRFLQVMRRTIALNGSFFTTERMLQQYVLKAYFR